MPSTDYWEVAYYFVWRAAKDTLAVDDGIAVVNWADACLEAFFTLAMSMRPDT